VCQQCLFVLKNNVSEVVALRDCLLQSNGCDHRRGACHLDHRSPRGVRGTQPGTVVLTSGHSRERFGELPPGVAYMPKPWQPLNVLMIAEQALSSSRGYRSA
jgi:hypothetical protein